MQIIKKINKELEFNYNISEVTSICMDIDYKVDKNSIVGVLNLEGDYVSSNLEDTKEDFNRKIDFNLDIEENVDINTIKVEIDDFTYDIDQNKLIINVDLSLTYEFVLFDEKKEFDKFIESREIDIDTLDLNKDNIIESNDVTSELIESKEEDRTIVEEPEVQEIIENEENEEDKRKIENSIIDMASNFNDDFITYHIYIVSDVDTLDGIAEKYHISVDVIKEYNNVDNLKSGMKLVIPISNE